MPGIREYLEKLFNTSPTIARCKYVVNFFDDNEKDVPKGTKNKRERKKNKNKHGWRADAFPTTDFGSEANSSEVSSSNGDLRADVMMGPNPYAHR